MTCETLTLTPIQTPIQPGIAKMVNEQRTPEKEKTPEMELAWPDVRFTLTEDGSPAMFLGDEQISQLLSEQQKAGNQSGEILIQMGRGQPLVALSRSQILKYRPFEPANSSKLYQPFTIPETLKSFKQTEAKFNKARKLQLKYDSVKKIWVNTKPLKLIAWNDIGGLLPTGPNHAFILVEGFIDFTTVISCPYSWLSDIDKYVVPDTVTFFKTHKLPEVITAEQQLVNRHPHLKNPAEEDRATLKASLYNECRSTHLMEPWTFASIESLSDPYTSYSS